MSNAHPVVRDKTRPTLLALVLLVTVSIVTSPAESQVTSISLNNTLSVSTLNWPNGTWYMRALLFDSSGSPVGSVTPSINFTLANQWPFIGVQMTADAPDGSVIRFYRKYGSDFADVNDPLVQFYDQTCPIGDVCNSAAVNSIALANTLHWTLFWDDFENGGTTRWSSVQPPT